MINNLRVGKHPWEVILKVTEIASSLTSFSEEKEGLCQSATYIHLIIDSGLVYGLPWFQERTKNRKEEKAFSAQG
ncbi:hypothetical protein NDU88_000662 [Pleurodeles waltl]|uniref:Uncharacterized protein n=1 Tax=Pleurodeles waltl TaxID=8319 RepID=A0AAV7U6Z5_PLEWA|nr:hypothetical protein NDU88_000662 [Pleurodeles waltl]